VLEWARSLAGRVMNDGGLTPEAAVDRAFRFAYARTPGEDERKMALEFLDREAKLAGTQQAAIVDLCHMLLNSNEFVYMN
jgi:hypothetical protein